MCFKSYIYNLSGQQFIINAKNGPFGEFLKTEACNQKVLPDMSVLIGRKQMENTKMSEIEMRY